jgi:RNA polymerase sigma factor (sigma-70 family)
MESQTVRTALPPCPRRVSHASEGSAVNATGAHSVTRLPQRDALYAEFSPLVRRLIRRYGTDHEIRADLVGEIYARFCDLYARFDPARGVPLRPYIARQLTWSIHTFCRAYWRQCARELQESAEEGAAGDSRAAPPVSSVEDIDDQLCRVLSAAIGRLPERQRQTLILRYYDDKTFDEIAAMLGVQPASARSLLRNAIANLRIEPSLRGFVVVRSSTVASTAASPAASVQSDARSDTRAA